MSLHKFNHLSLENLSRGAMEYFSFTIVIKE